MGYPNMLTAITHTDGDMTDHRFRTHARPVFPTRPAIAALCRLAVLSLSLVVGLAHGQPWPTKPIRLVSPYVAGGTNDVTARIVAQFLQTRLGQTVMVDNKPGANTRIATELVA